MGYNSEHGITPATIEKAIRDLIETEKAEEEAATVEEAGIDRLMPPEDASRIIEELESEMREAADNLEFEKAAAIRDQIMELKEVAAG